MERVINMKRKIKKKIEKEFIQKYSNVSNFKINDNTIDSFFLGFYNASDSDDYNISYISDAIMNYIERDQNKISNANTMDLNREISYFINNDTLFNLNPKKEIIDGKLNFVGPTKSKF